MLFIFGVVSLALIGAACSRLRLEAEVMPANHVVRDEPFVILVERLAACRQSQGELLDAARALLPVPPPMRSGEVPSARAPKRDYDYFADLDDRLAALRPQP